MITISADTSNDAKTTLFEKNPSIIIGIDACAPYNMEFVAAFPAAVAIVGANILNNTSPTPINNMDNTHKYGTRPRRTGRSNKNN